jgi:uncharacterized protein (DUF362 family)
MEERERNCSRRHFLGQCGVTGSLAAAGAAFRSFPIWCEAQEETGAPDLAVVQGDPSAATSAAMKLLGGMEQFVAVGATVLLKPNISFPNAEKWGSTTSPAVVRAVADLALRAGAARVIVADHTMRDSAQCFAMTGISKAFEGDEKVRLIPLDNESLFREAAIPKGKALRTVKIAGLLERCNCVINLPCAKSHAATDVSFGLKNLMGLVWDRQYFHEGIDLHTGIADLATLIRPTLTILDATRALLTGGPTGPGKVQELHMIVAGTDPLSVDSYAMTLAAWNNRTLDARSVPHLSGAAELGVGEIDIRKLRIKKETV